MDVARLSSRIPFCHSKCFSASGSGGSLSYQYKFVVSKDNLAVYTQDYNTKNTLAFTPTLAGNYTVAAYIKDNLSQKAYDDTNNLSFTVRSSIGQYKCF